MTNTTPLTYSKITLATSLAALMGLPLEKITTMLQEDKLNQLDKNFCFLTGVSTFIKNLQGSANDLNAQLDRVLQWVNQALLLQQGDLSMSQEVKLLLEKDKKSLDEITAKLIDSYAQEITRSNQQFKNNQTTTPDERQKLQVVKQNANEIADQLVEIAQHLMGIEKNLQPIVAAAPSSTTVMPAIIPKLR